MTAENEGTVGALSQERRDAGGVSAWLVRAGTRRERPGSRAIEVVDRDELWLAVPGEWWVLRGYMGTANSLNGHKVLASVPFEAPQRGDGKIVQLDLDLDFEDNGDEVAIQDEAEFHHHARTRDYPDEVVRGAWSGISAIARDTNRDWPFDGSMQQWLARRMTTDRSRRLPTPANASDDTSATTAPAKRRCSRTVR